MKLLVKVVIEQCVFIILKDENCYRLCQVPIGTNKHYVTCYKNFDTFEEAKTCLFESI